MVGDEDCDDQIADVDGWRCKPGCKSGNYDGWDCIPTPTGLGTFKSICTEIPWDGLVVGLETCDDGLDDGNGCDGTKNISFNLPGWKCIGGSNTTATICKEICGDGH